MIGPVFLATPIGMSEESALVHAQYLEDGWGVTVCQAKAVFEDKFQEVGGWSGFASFVGVGVNYHTRQPVFPTICCVQREVGKATGQIVEKALEAGKEVFTLLLAEDRVHLYRVHGFQLVNTENWQTGWTLDLIEIKEKGCA